MELVFHILWENRRVLVNIIPQMEGNYTFHTTSPLLPIYLDLLHNLNLPPN